MTDSERLGVLLPAVLIDLQLQYFCMFVLHALSGSPVFKTYSLQALPANTNLVAGSSVSGLGHFCCHVLKNVSVSMFSSINVLHYVRVVQRRQHKLRFLSSSKM